jgi:hypothetical protein
MQFVYSELITRFQDLLGTPKELIEETFNKPDATDVVMNRCISVKKFDKFNFLIIFEMNDEIVRFLSAYRIYPVLLNGADMSRMKPLEILTEFMNRYGVGKQIPGIGERKVLFERRMGIFFPGILDIEKYLEALKSV